MNLKYQFYRGYYQGREEHRARNGVTIVEFDPCWFDGDRDERTKILEKKIALFFEIKNKRLTREFKPDQALLDSLKFKKEQFGEDLHQFTTETIYPGLICGTGYTHETGKVGEFKLGFHFDHTSGLPILPGHTVKGVLRHAFPRQDMHPTKEPKEIKNAKALYIVDLLHLNDQIPEATRLAWVHQLEMSIFSNIHPPKAEKTNQKKTKQKNDVFMDAIISGANPNGNILGPDAITPHGEKIWENPNPLSFIKVLPEVQWEFSFLLHPVIIDNIPISAATKKRLFENILLDQGIGAKTNVGYGQFLDKRMVAPEPNQTSPGPQDDQNTRRQSRSDARQRPAKPAPPSKPGGPRFFRGKLTHKKELLMDAVVTQPGKPNKVKVYLQEGTMLEFVLSGYPNTLDKDALIQVYVQLKKDLSVNNVRYKGRKK